MAVTVIPNCKKSNKDFQKTVKKRVDNMNRKGNIVSTLKYIQDGISGRYKGVVIRYKIARSNS